MRRNHITLEDITASKSKIKSILKANTKIENLNDQDLYIFQLIIRKELQKRKGDFTEPGTTRNMEMI